MEANEAEARRSMKTPVMNEIAIRKLRALQKRMDSFSHSGYPAGHVLIQRWIAQLNEAITELEKENP